MKKLKPVAYEIIEMKRELLKENHSEIIKKSLEITVDRMLAEGYIDLDIQLYLKDNICSLKEFKSIINSCEKYMKTKEELKIECDDLSKSIDRALKEKGMKDFYVNIDMNSNKLNICKVLYLDAECLKRYFYIQSDKYEEFESLMRNNSFIQQFAALRLPRIISNYIEGCSVLDNCKMGKSHPYFKAEANNYAIDLIFSINLKTAMRINEKSSLLEDVYHLSEEAYAYFKEKVSI